MSANGTAIASLQSSVASEWRQIVTLAVNGGVHNEGDDGYLEWDISEYGFLKAPYVMAIPYGGQPVMASIGDLPSSTTTTVYVNYYMRKYGIAAIFVMLFEPI